MNHLDGSLPIPLSVEDLMKLAVATWRLTGTQDFIVPFISILQVSIWSGVLENLSLCSKNFFFLSVYIYTCL